MRRQALITMIDAASSAGASDAVANANCDLLSVQVSGTFSSGTIKIQGKTYENAPTWTDIAVINKTTMNLTSGSVGITAKGIYAADITGVTSVRVNVESVSGGNVTIVGSFEDTSRE